MTIKELRDAIANLPDDAPVDLRWKHAPGFEATISADRIKIDGDKLILIVADCVG